MNDLENLKNEYISKFKDYFPNIGISKEYEIEIIKDCLKQGKNAYELGYFELESNILY